MPVELVILTPLLSWQMAPVAHCQSRCAGAKGLCALQRLECQVSCPPIAPGFMMSLRTTPRIRPLIAPDAGTRIVSSHLSAQVRHWRESSSRGMANEAPYEDSLPETRNPKPKPANLKSTPGSTRGFPSRTSGPRSARSFRQLQPPHTSPLPQLKRDALSTLW